MKIYKRHVLFSLSIVLLIQVATAQQQTGGSASSLVVSPWPLVDASMRLQEVYRTVVTYEEPVPTWRGDLTTQPGWTGGSSKLFPVIQSFLMPESGPGTDLASVLENTIAAYHQATSGTRFQVLSSKLGYHIVPVQMHDETGRSVPATSALDRIITVPSEARTAMKHLLAISAALNSTVPIHVDISAVRGKPGGFDEAFRAQPEVFQWGVHSVVARDALIDLWVANS